jgi:hypothetical protein
MTTTESTGKAPTWRRVATDERGQIDADYVSLDGRFWISRPPDSMSSWWLVDTTAHRHSPRHDVFLDTLRAAKRTAAEWAGIATGEA